MFNFESWIITIVAGSLLICVFEMVLPVGKMNKICSNIFGVIYIYIVMSPIIDFVKSII